MRTLAVLTTTAAIALLGVANAENAAAPAASTQTGDPVARAAASYAAYQVDLTELRAMRLNDARALETAIDKATSHNRDQLSRGWIAYGASTAAQSSAFVQGVRDAARRYGRDQVIWGITADPSYARTLRGGADATRLVLDSANADGARIIAVADRYREHAYSLQRQSWARQVAPQQNARVQRIRSNGAAGANIARLGAVSQRLAVTPVSLSPSSDPTVFGGRRFWDAVQGGSVVEVSSTPASASWRLDGPRGEAVNRMTSIAALQALDATTERASDVNRLLDEPRSRQCIEMSQLQLYQCMSAARFRYENAFCLGQHAMRDVGQCISAVARPASAS